MRTPEACKILLTRKFHIAGRKLSGLSLITTNLSYHILFCDSVSLSSNFRPHRNIKKKYHYEKNPKCKTRSCSLRMHNFVKNVYQFCRYRWITHMRNSQWYLNLGKRQRIIHSILLLGSMRQLQHLHWHPIMTSAYVTIYYLKYFLYDYQLPSGIAQCIC